MTAIDYNCLDGPQFAGLSDAAWAMWTRARLWCDRHQTNEIPESILILLSKSPPGQRRRVASDLVKAGLWDELAHGGWQARAGSSKQNGQSPDASHGERKQVSGGDGRVKMSSSERAKKAAAARWGQSQEPGTPMLDANATDAQAYSEHHASNANASPEHDASDAQVSADAYAQASSPPVPPSQRSRAEQTRTNPTPSEVDAALDVRPRASEHASAASSEHRAQASSEHPKHDASSIVHGRGDLVHPDDLQAEFAAHEAFARIVKAVPHAAEDLAGAAQFAGLTGDDARAAVRTFMLKNAGDVRTLRPSEVVNRLGRYLKNQRRIAKQEAADARSVSPAERATEGGYRKISAPRPPGWQPTAPPPDDVPPAGAP